MSVTYSSVVKIASVEQDVLGLRIRATPFSVCMHFFGHFACSTINSASARIAKQGRGDLFDQLTKCNKFSSLNMKCHVWRCRQSPFCIEITDDVISKRRNNALTRPVHLFY